ncbi:MAG: bifunctional metallophosphatase/5'-nucleotidase [Thermotogae bacterium]|nr:bifunctional metallophosphatase/5'-nucleotidase [Thermotogota bacterium]
MKKGLVLLWIILPIFAFADTLAIIHINDTHHHLFPHGEWNGISSAAHKIRELKSFYPNNLFFHAGDIFVGDFSFPYGLGRAELRLLSLLSPDAITLGNHELDITPDSLYSVLNDVGGFTTFLSANLRPDTIPLASLVRPYTTFSRSGRLICVLGLTTNQFNLLNPAQDPVQFENPVYVAQIYEDTFDLLGCDLRLILSHAGVHMDSSIASSTRSYDLIVSGHTHACYDGAAAIPNASGDTTYLAEACEHYKAVGLWLVDMDSLKVIGHRLFRLSDTSALDPEFVDSLNVLQARIESRYGPVFDDSVAYAVRELTNVPDSSQYLDTPLGNLITDALRSKAASDVAVLPYFYIAEPFTVGRITSNDVLMAFPYGLSETAITGTNMYLLRIHLTGADFYRLLSVAQEFVGSSPIVQVSGMAYRFSPDSSPPLLPEDITIGGAPLDTTAVYSVAADMGTLHLASLLGVTPVMVETTSYTMFEAMREYFREMGALNHTSEGRIAYRNSLNLAERRAVESAIRVSERTVSSNEPFSVYDATGRLLARNVFVFRTHKVGVFFVKRGREVIRIILR